MGSRYLHNFFEGVYVLWRTKCYGLFDFKNPTRIFWSLANILRQSFQIWILLKQRKYMVENLLLPDKVVECFNNFKYWSRNILFFGKKKRPWGLSNLPSTSLGEVSRSFGTCFKIFAKSLSYMNWGFWRKHFSVFVIFLFGKTKTFWDFFGRFLDDCSRPLTKLYGEFWWKFFRFFVKIFFSVSGATFWASKLFLKNLVIE